MLVFVILARLLEPRAFGVVALAAVAVAFMSIFVEQGLGQALVQRQDLAVEHCDTAFWACLASGTLLAGILVVAAEPMANALNEPQLAEVLRWLALVLPIAALSSVPQALFQKELAFRVLAERTIIANIVGGAAGVAAAFAGFGVWSLVIQTLLSAAAGSLMLWIKTDWRPGLRVSLERFRELFGFGWKIMGSNLLSFAGRNMDNLLIGAVLGPIALGLYSVAYRMLEVMTDVSTRTVASVAFPVFSTVQKDVARLRRGFLDATHMCAAIALPFFALTSVLAPEIVPTVFGPQWRASVPVMQVLCLFGALFPILLFNTSVLMAMGRAGWVLIISALNAICTVIGFAVTVHLGIVAVAVSYAAVNYALSPVSFFATKRVLGFDPRIYLRGLVGPVVATIVSVGIVAVARVQLAPVISAALVLCILVPAGAIVYMLTLRVVMPGMIKKVVHLMIAGLPSFRLRRKRLATGVGDAAT
jgi:PST family polysaccharide transporter